MNGTLGKVRGYRLPMPQQVLFLLCFCSTKGSHKCVWSRGDVTFLQKKGSAK